MELGVIQYLNDNFDNVILVVNTNNAFELGWVADYPNITAVLWAPGAGGDTCRSIADVLSGAVNPSGHLADTFAYDAFSSPAMQNMDEGMIAAVVIVPGILAIVRRWKTENKSIPIFKK